MELFDQLTGLNLDIKPIAEAFKACDDLESLRSKLPTHVDLSDPCDEVVEWLKENEVDLSDPCDYMWVQDQAHNYLNELDEADSVITRKTLITIHEAKQTYRFELFQDSYRVHLDGAQIGTLGMVGMVALYPSNTVKLPTRVIREFLETVQD